ncbi:hypothetical protein VTP01DRAFT_10390 [Rhizomucor pusillus]|uniref:uncharacterized protein n=1 Tax=Rhizomucor pusillus TaxID=4840 RepID=UPI003742A414
MSILSWLFPSSSSSSNKNLEEDIPKKTTCYHIEGFLSCHYFHLATEVADRLSAEHSHIKADVSAYIKQQWYERSRELQEEFKTKHTTSPFIYEGCVAGQQTFVGGYTDFAKKVKETYKMNVPLD